VRVAAMTAETGRIPAITETRAVGSVTSGWTLPYEGSAHAFSGLRMYFTDSSSSGVPASLRYRRERAERKINGLRAGILVLLALAAAAYAPSLPQRLDITNLELLVPTLAWTVGQYLLWYRRSPLPEWLPLTNAVIDITAVTAIIGGYAVAQSGVLALRSPIFLMYFVVLAARPVASSVRKASLVALLAFIEYGVLVSWLISTGRVQAMVDPVNAVQMVRVSFLDEGAKLLLLGIGGLISIYATKWVEQLAIESATESEERERVQTRLVQAELDTLKLQLSPHFLFNALNGAIALIGTNAREAEKMVSAISDFLRLVLGSSKEQEVSLEAEMTLLQHYLDIQRVRFGEKLKTKFNVEEGLERAMIPSLILQPLVENAIRHGIGQRASGGNIDITIRSAGENLTIDIVDDGIGLSTRRSRERSRGTGLGLANTATRLNHLYKDNHEFETGPSPTGGFAVHLRLPLRLARPLSTPAKSTRAELTGV
jgi:signal transduction histidine kinase